MPDPIYLFLDFDHTLSDPNELFRQYVGELAGLLTRELGGDAAAWSAALGPNLQASKARYEEKFTGSPLAGYSDWIEEERARVANDVITQVGVAPPTRETLAKFAARLQFDALTGCNASYEGAEETLRALFEADVRTQMASSQESEYLFAALLGAGIESYVESKFGPDLVDCAKEGPEFYHKIFEATGIRPSQAIVVDDQPMCLDWAEETGARVIQACAFPGAPAPEFPVAIRNLSELVALITGASS